MSAEGLDWMPFFWRRFWGSGSVARMSDSAALLYMWLLSQQFEEGYLEPADVLRKVVPARFASRWTKLWAEVEPCFEVLEDGRLQNAVCAEHRENALELVRKRRASAAAAGIASGESRRKRTTSKGERPLNDRSTPDATAVERLPNKGQERREEEHASRVLRTREDDPAPPAKPIPPRLAAPSTLDPEPAPSLTLRAREQIALHPVLDIGVVHAAALRWENHLREHGRLDAWKSGTWAANLAKWARWGPSRTVAAIDCTIGCGKFTPFEPTHRDAPAPTAAASPAVTRERADRAAYERDLERRWEAQHTVERDVASPLGGTVKRLVLDGKYPGHEAAERELGVRGPAGTPDVRKSA